MTIRFYFRIFLPPNFVLWILDNFIVLIFFGSKVKPKAGLPDNLKEITWKKYQAIRRRVIEFNTNVLFNKSVDLLLTSDEINILHYYRYDEYSNMTNKEKAFEMVQYYEIKNNELIEIQEYPFLFFNKKPIESKTAIKFTLNNGKVSKETKILVIINHSIHNPKYIPNEKIESSNLIYFILGSFAEPIVQKLKAIKIENNQLILSS